MNTQLEMSKRVTIQMINALADHGRREINERQRNGGYWRGRPGVIRGNEGAAVLASRIGIASVVPKEEWL